jgi:hypothetical protein
LNQTINILDVDYSTIRVVDLDRLQSFNPQNSSTIIISALSKPIMSLLFLKRLNDSIEENAAKLLKIRAKMRSLIIILGVFICCFNMMLNNIF